MMMMDTARDMDTAMQQVVVVLGWGKRCDDDELKCGSLRWEGKLDRDGNGRGC